MSAHSHKLANEALALWDLPTGAQARLINVSENETFLVEAGGFRSVLRLCRPGYQTHVSMQSELNWIDALRASDTVRTPAVLRGRDGHRIQAIGTTAPRKLVMFAFAPGTTPDLNSDQTARFETLGRMAAELHAHARVWQKPTRFTRPHWGLDQVFGVNAHWGNWRDAPNVGATERAALERAERKVCENLTAYGVSSANYGLIHADMRLANLLVDGPDITLIDFDDCGFGWFLYDFAAAISFVEDDPAVPDLRAAWLTGYQSHSPIKRADQAALSSLIMLRRFALLAWIGSHIAAPEPQALAPDFAARSAKLAEAFLSGDF